MLKSWLASLRFSHISLALVGLMWVFPFLHYEHKYPLTTFFQEWWSTLIGLLALTLLAGRDFWNRPKVPRIVQLPVALIAIVLLQSALNMIAYFDQALLIVLYLLFAALLMMLGAHFRDRFGMAVIAQVLAAFLLLGAETNALFGVLQHFRWHSFLDPVLVMKTSTGVFGNLAQPNHFANYITLGLVSLGLLFHAGRLKAHYVVLLAAPLLLVMTLSGSRSTWLYLLLMSGLSWWWSQRDANMLPLLRYSLLLIAGYGLMHLVVRLPFMSGVEGIDTMERLFGDNISGRVRMKLWHEALLIAAQSPWIGVGFGQFAWQHFQLLPELYPGELTGMYNNAHNVIFQLAAETGILGVLALLGAAIVWLMGIRHAPRDAAHWWGYVVLGVLAIHSLLEYPLWYAYFVAIAAILLGALDQTSYQLKLRNTGRISVLAIIILGTVTLLQMRNGYGLIKEVLQIRPTSMDDRSNAVNRVHGGLVKVYEGSILAPYAELFMVSLIEVSENNISEKLELNTRSMRFIPMSMTVYRQAFLLAQAGQQEQAKIVLEQALWCFPDDFIKSKQKMADLAERDPEHFLALLEFALRKEREVQSAVFAR